MKIDGECVYMRMFHCGHFDREEISFLVINFMLTPPRNESIRKETSAHANKYQNKGSRSKDQNKNDFHRVF